MKRFCLADLDGILTSWSVHDRLPIDYDSWLKRGNEKLEDIRARGFTPLQVNIDPRNFADWCRREGLQPNASACRTYAVAFSLGPNT